MDFSPLVTLGIVIGTILVSGAVFYLIIGKFPLFVGLRYLFSKKQQNVINVITTISIVGITFVTAALVLVMSIFNGFQILIEDLFAAFDPDLKVEAAMGRTIPVSDSLIAQISALDGVAYVVPSIENKAMIKYGDKQHIVEVKGIRPEHLKISPLDTLIYEGKYSFLHPSGSPACILGGGVAGFINATTHDDLNPVELIVASESMNSFLNPGKAIRSRSYFPAGFFSVQIEYDNKYVLIDFAEAQRLFDYSGECTAYEIKLEDKGEATALKPAVAALLGPDYKVRTWYEQHETLYKVMQNEKLVAYLVLTLILLLAGVNIVGSLSMIVLEKTRDVAVLKSFGASQNLMRKVFLSLGFMIGSIGGLTGILIGMLVGFFQETYGLVKLNGGDSFLINAYPMDMRVSDFIVVFLTVFGLSLLAAWFPAARAARIQVAEALRM